MTRALPLLALVCLVATPAAGAVEQAPREELPEASRWLSFVRLVEARWDVRTRVPPADEAARLVLLDRCAHDAWHLSRPGLLSRNGPCRRLLGEPAADAPKPRAAGSSTTARETPDEAGFHRCVMRAATKHRPQLLDLCLPGVEQGALSLRAQDDEARFQSWFSACKRALLHDAVPPDASVEAHARHCLRTLPTFYEVRWMKKLSEYWTADEQQRLYQRSQQLGAD